SGCCCPEYQGNENTRETKHQPDQCSKFDVSTPQATGSDQCCSIENQKSECAPQKQVEHVTGYCNPLNQQDQDSSRVQHHIQDKAKLNVDDCDEREKNVACQQD